MNITEKSKEYAKGKALDAITAAIEQAYVDGYNDGMKHLENEKLEAIKDGVEYKDLGLKSGTQWSSKRIINEEGRGVFSYMEVSKLFIPTKEQFEELCRDCFSCYEISNICHGIKFIGTNGESIVIEYSKIKEISHVDDQDSFQFWLKDDGDSIEKLTAKVSIKDHKATPIFEKVYMGIKLPVMLVKKE